MRRWRGATKPPIEPRRVASRRPRLPSRGGSGQVWLNWAVLLEGTVIGRVEATLHDRIAEIAYVFGPAWWGHGYATEATTWLLHEVRGAGAEKCWATVAPENRGSIRLLRRLGFAPAAPDVSLLSYQAGDLVFARRRSRTRSYSPPP